MRHILVHAYYSIDADALWRVVEQHLPPLVQELEAVSRAWDTAAAPERPE